MSTPILNLSNSNLIEILTAFSPPDLTQVDPSSHLEHSRPALLEATLDGNPTLLQLPPQDALFETSVRAPLPTALTLAHYTSELALPTASTIKSDLHEVILPSIGHALLTRTDECAGIALGLVTSNGDRAAQDLLLSGVAPTLILPSQLALFLAFANFARSISDPEFDLAALLAAFS